MVIAAREGERVIGMSSTTNRFANSCHSRDWPARASTPTEQIAVDCQALRGIRAVTRPVSLRSMKC
jgi:hypothetical protein